MSLDVQHRSDQFGVSIAGIDVKKVFRETSLKGGNVVIPTTFHPLPDFRPASDAALGEALEGLAPALDAQSRFDPLLGPFSHQTVKATPWAQSLDFLRDIKSANIGSTRLVPAWIKTWLEDQEQHLSPSMSLFVSAPQGTTKTDRLMWRSRRILNCLSHVLSILNKLEDRTKSLFWDALVHDIAKVGAPTDTLWSSLKDGFNLLSPRAIWLRAIALLGVEAAFPGFLRTDLVDKSLSDVKASFQSDGLILGGSIVGTLSAGADMCMLGRLPVIESVLHNTRVALASLRHKDNTLVTFGTGSASYRQLLNAVIGPGSWKPSTLLLDSGIVRLSAQETTVWMRSPQKERAWGAICDIEVASGALITSYSADHSAVAFRGPVQVTQARCKRRDEQDLLIIEASATLGLAGKSFYSLRQIRVAKNGSRIEGEDIIRPETPTQAPIVKEICFALPSNCAFYLSKDEQSVVIVTSQQQAWRFRAQGMDISVEIGSDTSLRNVSSARRYFVVCRCLDMQRKSDFRANWQLVLEDLE
jgi:hypothetical protein